MKVWTKVALSLCGSVVAAAPLTAWGQAFPSRPVRMIVPFAPAGATDVIARLVADSMKDDLKQPVLVDNVAGASGGVGAQQVANAKPDGYTIMIMGNGLLAAPLTIKAYENFDMATQLSPIAYLGESPMLAYVNPSVPAKNFREFIDYVKSRPGKVNYGTAGGSADLDTGLFMYRAGLDTQKISYKGGAPLLTAVVQNEVQFGASSPLSIRGLMEAGKVRVIGVMTSRPWPGDPSAQVAAQVIPGFEGSVPSWAGAMGPRGLPGPVVDTLAGSMRSAVNKPTVKKKLEEQGMYVYDGGPDEMAKMTRRTIDTWREAARITGMKPE